MLIGLFERCMRRRGVKDSDPYDWEKIPQVSANIITSSHTHQSQQVIINPLGWIVMYVL